MSEKCHQQTWRGDLESSFFRGGYQPGTLAFRGLLVAAESNLEYRLKALADLFWVNTPFP